MSWCLKAAKLFQPKWSETRLHVYIISAHIQVPQKHGCKCSGLIVFATLSLPSTVGITMKTALTCLYVVSEWLDLKCSNMYKHLAAEL